MALTETQKHKIEQEEAYRAGLNSRHAKHTYGLPALLSFFIPGLGQLIKGQVGKGILFFFGTILGLAFFVIPGVIIWIWQIADAYNN
jgi:TM2 domain-containing membrane protein YozV